MNRWGYKIRAYYSQTVEPPKERGGFAIETVHSCASSRDMEIAAFMHRMDKGDIGRIEVIKL